MKKTNGGVVWDVAKVGTVVVSAVAFLTMLSQPRSSQSPSQRLRVRAPVALSSMDTVTIATFSKGPPPRIEPISEQDRKAIYFAIGDEAFYVELRKAQDYPGPNYHGPKFPTLTTAQYEEMRRNLAEHLDEVDGHAIARVWGVSYSRLQEIVAEGYAKNWPLPIGRIS